MPGVRPQVISGLFGGSCGLLLSALVEILQLAGDSPSAAACAAAAAAGLAAGLLGQLRRLPGLIGAASGLLFGGWIWGPSRLAPVMPAWPLLIAAALTWRRVLRSESSEPPAPAAWWEAALVFLGAAGVPAWERALALLGGGGWTLGACSALAGLFLGAGAAAWAAGRAPAGLRESPFAASTLLLATGLAGAVGLAGLRFIGLTFGSADRLQSPLRHAGDAALILGQAALLAAGWSAAPAAAVWGRPQSGMRRAALTGAGLAGLAAGWIGLKTLGCETALAAAALAAAVLGCACRPWPGLRGTVAWQLRLAALALVMGSAWRHRALFSEIWHNRLNAAFPGGDFIFLKEDGDESLGAYRFPTGTTVLLSDGVAFTRKPAGGRRTAHWAMLLHRNPSRALVAGTRSPAVLGALAAHGVEVSAFDPHPAAATALETISPSWRQGLPGLGLTTGYWKRPPARPLAFDVALLLDPPPPAGGERARRALSPRVLLALKSRLGPGGILAYRPPSGADPGLLERDLALLRTRFATAGLLDAGDGPTLIATDSSSFADTAERLRRAPVEIHADDLTLEAAAAAGPPWVIPP